MIDEDTKKLINLKERFNQESKAITSQITFVEDSIILPSIKNKNNKYIDFVDKLPTTISNIQQQLSDTIAKLDSKLTELKSSLDHLQYRNISDKLFNIDIRSVEGEFINYILDIIDEGENDRLKIAKIVQVDLEYAANIRMTTDSGDFYIKLLTNEEALMKYIDICLDMYHNRHIDTIKESIEAIEYYLKLFQLIDISTTNNIYRQAFIQLIALFDAIVFDCVRTVFNLDFFNQLKFYKDGSIKYSEIAKYENFESFKIATIEYILKNCYVKDLLSISHKQNKDLFVINGNDNYATIREILNRRNCHIHNNGIADNAYLAEFNLYNLNQGTFLEIDRTYFYTTYGLCSGFITNYTEYFSKIT